MDVLLHAPVTPAFLDDQPFPTFDRLIPVARAFSRAPPGPHVLLGRARSCCNETDDVRDLLMTVCAGMEAMFGEEGVVLHDAKPDPAVPNRLRP